MRLLIYFCFFLSGLCGLSYEVLWARYLKLLTGTDAFSYAVVLVTFMGGLAAGNALFGRISDRRAGKLSLYGLLELGIGISCALFPYFLEAASRLYFMLASTDPGAAGNLALKFALSAVTMLLPTILMGGTLPVLSTYSIRHINELGSKVGLLYFINSAGAACGCLLTGFYLIARLGLEASVYLMAAVNMGIGVTCLCLRSYEQTREDDCAALRAEGAGRGLQAADENALTNPAAGSQAEISLTYACIFLSGILAMSLEVIWIRLLSLVLDSSTYSFSIMLFTFISGITLGAMAVAVIMRKKRNALLLFGLSELGVFVSLVMLMPVYERLPYYFNVLASMLVREESNYPVYQSLKILISILIMAGPTICIGMTLPLASSVCVRRINILGRGIGSVFSINTMGNVLGAALCGLVIVPALGLQKTMEVIILMSGMLGAVLLCAAMKNRGVWRYAIPAAVPLIFLAFCSLTADWSGAVFNSGYFRLTGRIAQSYQEYLAKREANEVLFHEDGPDVSVVVTRHKKETHYQLSLRVNGKTDASTGLDMDTQVLAGHIPLLLHPDPKDIMIVGYGSGITAGAVLRHPVASCDIAELSGAVVRAARLFNFVSGNPLADPRARLWIADGKEFLRLQPEKSYDIIISEPSNPWIAGIGNLFSVEYFAEAARHLKPGGMMVQWLQLYETTDEIISILMNSLRSVFPYATVWNLNNDIIVIASLEAQRPDYVLLERRLKDPKIISDLTHPLLSAGIKTPLQLLSAQMLSSETFRSLFTGRGPLNSDYFPVVEYEAPRALFCNSVPENFIRSDDRLKSREENRLFIAGYPGSRDLSAEEMLSLQNLFAVRSGKNEKAISGILSYDLFMRGGSAAAAVIDRLMTDDDSLDWLARRRLWEAKASSGPMTREDARNYLNFEFQLLTEKTSVFAETDRSAFKTAQKLNRQLEQGH